MKRPRRKGEKEEQEEGRRRRRTEKKKMMSIMTLGTRRKWKTSRTTNHMMLYAARLNQSCAPLSLRPAPFFFVFFFFSLSLSLSPTPSLSSSCFFFTSPTHEENQIYRGLDTEEHEFLESLATKERSAEEERDRVVQEQLKQFQEAQVRRNPSEPVDQPQQEVVLVARGDGSKRKSQAALLSGLVRKRSASEDQPEPSPKRPKPSAESPRSAPPAAPAPPPALAALVDYGDDDDDDDDDHKSSGSSD